MLFEYIYTFVELAWYMTIKPSLRLMCALEGKYLVCEDAHMSMDQSSKEPDELQCVQFSCSVPVMNGRGFIEVLFLLSPKLSTEKSRDGQANFSMRRISKFIYYPVFTFMAHFHTHWLLLSVSDVLTHKL